MSCQCASARQRKLTEHVSVPPPDTQIWPLGHAVQAVAPASLVSPVGHSCGELDASLQKLPAGQIVQLVAPVPV